MVFTGTCDPSTHLYQRRSLLEGKVGSVVARLLTHHKSYPLHSGHNSSGHLLPLYWRCCDIGTPVLLAWYRSRQQREGLGRDRQILQRQVGENNLINLGTKIHSTLLLNHWIFVWGSEVRVGTFGVWTFGVRTFGVWTFGVRTFGVWTFGVWIFGTRTFWVRTFGVRIFGVGTFGVRMCGVQTFGVWTFRVRTFRVQPQMSRWTPNIQIPNIQNWTLNVQTPNVKRMSKSGSQTSKKKFSYESSVIWGPNI